MNAAVPIVTPSLDEVQRSFDLWRASRSRRGHTPQSLRRRAAALLEYHRPAHICQALGINADALKCWSDALSKPVDELVTVSDDIAPPFVELPDLQTQSLQIDTFSALTVELPDGTRVTADGSFSLSQLWCVVCTRPEAVSS